MKTTDDKIWAAIGCVWFVAATAIAGYYIVLDVIKHWPPG